MRSGLHTNGTAGDPAATGDGRGRFADALAIQGRNLTALAEAQRALVEGFGAVAERQVEAAGAAVRNALAFLSAAPPGVGSRAGVERGVDALKAALLERTARSNLVVETAARASAEVAGILQERALAALDEFKAALVGAPAPGGSAVAAGARPGRPAPADA